MTAQYTLELLSCPRYLYGPLWSWKMSSLTAFIPNLFFGVPAPFPHLRVPSFLAMSDVLNIFSFNRNFFSVLPWEAFQMNPLLHEFSCKPPQQFDPCKRSTNAFYHLGLNPLFRSRSQRHSIDMTRERLIFSWTRVKCFWHICFSLRKEL